MGSEREGAAGDSTLTALYHRALPLVYGYLLPRCGSAGLAEDLTVAWLVGVARHKLVDHWRRIDLERRKLGVVGCDAEPAEDPWDAQLDVAAAHAALSRLSAHHRAALTLRYLDGLPVAEVAGELGRSLHATETLLVRARAAFRRVYEEGQGHDA